MKPKVVDTEALRTQAIQILMALKTQQELEAALDALGDLNLRKVVGYEHDGTPVTKQSVLADYQQDWRDHEAGKTISNEEMVQWINDEFGIAPEH